jgi:hypothetical protein
MDGGSWDWADERPQPVLSPGGGGESYRRKEAEPLESGASALAQRKFAILHEISMSHYQWNNLALSLAAVAILVNLDLHYIPGGILMMIAIVIILASFAYSIVKQHYADIQNFEKLYAAQVAGFWVIGITLICQVPFLLWAAVIMFQRVNQANVACNNVCNVTG